MATVAPYLFVAVILVAFVAWILAVTAAFKVWSMSPPGEKFGNYMRLGLLQTSYLEQRLGPSIRPTLVRYRNALFLFLACVILGAAAGIFAAMPA